MELELFSKTGWLNVVALKDNTSSSYIGEFANGKVYQLDLADIKNYGCSCTSCYC